MRVVRPDDDLGFAIVEGRAVIKECFKHVRVSQVPGLIAPVKPARQKTAGASDRGDLPGGVRARKSLLRSALAPAV